MDISVTVLIGAITILTLVIVLIFLFKEGGEKISVQDENSQVNPVEDESSADEVASMVQKPTDYYFSGNNSGNWRYGEREPYYLYYEPPKFPPNFKMVEREVPPANIQTVHDNPNDVRYTPIEILMAQEGWMDPHKIMVPYKSYDGKSKINDSKFQSLPVVTSTGLMDMEPIQKTDSKYKQIREYHRPPIVDYDTKIYKNKPYLPKFNLGKHLVGEGNIGNDLKSINFSTNIRQASHMLPEEPSPYRSPHNKYYITETF